MAKVGDDAGMVGGTEGDDNADEVEGADEAKGAGMAVDADGAEGDARMAEVTFVPVGAEEACEEAGVAEGGIEGIEEWCAREREDALASRFRNSMRLFVQSTNGLW